MGVHHGERTGIDALAGIASWEEAARIGDFCHESSNGCPCRANVTCVARQVERDFGADAARAWVVRNYRSAKKRGSEFAGVAASARDAKRLTGVAWPSKAIAAADVLAPFLEGLTGLPLEMKVTLAGSLLASLRRLTSPPDQSHAQLLGDAVAKALAVEPLHPFLSDAEWRDVGPPETYYLTEKNVRDRVSSTIREAVAMLDSEVPRLTAEDAVLGALFHLGRGFRRGITETANRALDVAPVQARLLYVPGTVIGSPARH